MPAESSNPWSELITKKDIFDLHFEGLLTHGGEGSEELYEGCVDSALAAAWSAGQYLEGEVAVPRLTFSAYLLHHLAFKHCFLDGNKRVAWATGLLVLRRVGVTLAVSTEEAHRFVLQMLEESLPPETVLAWLTERMVAL